MTDEPPALPFLALYFSIVSSQVNSHCNLSSLSFIASYSHSFLTLIFSSFPFSFHAYFRIVFLLYHLYIAIFSLSCFTNSFVSLTVHFLFSLPFLLVNFCLSFSPFSLPSIPFPYLLLPSLALLFLFSFPLPSLSFLSLTFNCLPFPSPSFPHFLCLSSPSFPFPTVVSPSFT